MPTLTDIRAALKEEFGARNVRLTKEGEIHVRGTMPNTDEVGWYLYGYTGSDETIAQLGLSKLGRPPLPPDVRRSAVVRARVSQQQAERFERLGGAEWLREAIDKASAS